MSTIIPAGTYVLGDPCYHFTDHSEWMFLLGSSDYFRQPSGVTSRGDRVYALGTAYGDGVYHSNEGHELGVDAGLIGLTPKHIAEPLINSYNVWLGYDVTFDTDVEMWDEGGVLHFGHITVDTTDGGGWS